MKRPFAAFAGPVLVTVFAAAMSTAVNAAESDLPFSFVPDQSGQASFQFQTAQHSGDVPSDWFIPVQAPSSDALMLLLDQFSEMRNELQTLRGMVEEQAHQIQRMQRDSMDRYSDLDARLSAIYQNMENGNLPGAAAPGTGSQQQQSQPAQQPPAQNPQTTPNVITPATGQAPAQQTGAARQVAAASQLQQRPSGPALPAALQNQQQGMLTEQQVYQISLDVLLQENQYEQSIGGFEQYLQRYPNGRYVTNALYWKGQAYVNLSDLDNARQAFETIVTDYPDGRKIEDAMYSLGTVYHRLGDTARGRELLQDVRTRFPNTSAANLADIYLRSLN